MQFLSSSLQPSFLHRLESRVVWTVCQVFPLWDVQIWCVVTRVRKSGVFLLLSSRLILSIFFTSFRLGLYCVCSSTVCPVFEQSLNDDLLLLCQICNLRIQFFCLFGLGLRCHHCLLWRLSQWAYPLKNLALNSCPSAGVQSSLRLEDTSCSQIFDGDDSISYSILRIYCRAFRLPRMVTIALCLLPTDWRSTLIFYLVIRPAARRIWTQSLCRRYFDIRVCHGWSCLIMDLNSLVNFGNNSSRQLGWVFALLWVRM